MLKIKGNYFILETEHVSMVVRAVEERTEYLYFGEKFADYSGLELMHAEGNAPWNAPLSLFSQWGKTDFREPSFLVRFADGSCACDFRLKSAKIVKRDFADGLPRPYGEEKCLRLEFTDAPSKLKLTLTYTPYADSDAFCVAASLFNGGKKPVVLENFASAQLEVWGRDFDFTTFDGTWACERTKHKRALAYGKFENASYTGSSSAFHNPFVMLSREGEAYGVNLVYSGNHREIAETDDSGRTRLIAGINPFCFNWELGAGETFYAPEAVLVYGKTEEDVSVRMHRFVNRHIVRGKWSKRERPILVNNWEGTYFDFNEKKILDIAKKGAEVGAELFVLDDGWFGKRDSDTCSLGDWFDYTEKTGGLDKLADKIRELGLSFGIWVEPEMISEDSELYRKHPDYAMKIPRREPTRMRNQLMINLADPQVQGFVFRAVSKVITQCRAAYVKWDYNRHMTDCFDKNTRGGEYYHRYILGLYSVLQKLTERFPNVLFESCASGGARFDLGMLCYMPQTWTSDNTDARDRISIQSGTAYAYPQSTMGAHVSASPNHQTGNSNPLETRFRVACGGLLGYESDLTKCSGEELSAIKNQIAFYKKHRAVIQYGQYYRLGDSFGGDWSGFISVAEGGAKAVSVVAVPVKRTGASNYRARFKGLDAKTVYRVSLREPSGIMKEICVAGGDLLNKGGVNLDGIFSETNPREVSYPVYTRMFVFEKFVKDKAEKKAK